MIPSSGKPRFDVVGLGFNTIDHLCVVSRHVRLDSKQRMVRFDRQPGGQVATALVALQRWGLRTAYVGSFGGDAGGAESRDSLAAEGIDLSGTVVRPGVGNQESVILIDEVSGERSVLWQRPDGLALRPDELSREHVESTRLLLLDAYDMPAAVTAARWAKGADGLVMLDADFPAAGIEELLGLTDLLIVSPEFPIRLTGQQDIRCALRATARRGPHLCAVTLGPGGALVLEDKVFTYTSAFRVPVVDSTGAGDVFHAGFIYGVLQGWPTRQTLRFAAAAAALKCAKLGGRPGIPTVAQAEALADGAGPSGGDPMGTREAAVCDWRGKLVSPRLRRPGAGGMWRHALHPSAGERGGQPQRARLGRYQSPDAADGDIRRRARSDSAGAHLDAVRLGSAASAGDGARLRWAARKLRCLRPRRCVGGVRRCGPGVPADQRKCARRA